MTSDDQTAHAPTDAPGVEGLLVDAEQAAQLKERAQDWPSWTLTPRQLCDLEMLASGAFAPLTGFLGEADHAGVVSSMRLADGTLWPAPVVLEVDAAFAEPVAAGDRVGLRDPEGTLLAALEVTSTFTPTDAAPGSTCLGGPVQAVQLPNQYDFPDLRRTPAQARAETREGRWARTLAAPTRQPLLGADIAELKRHVNTMGARVMLMAEVGDDPDGILDRFTLTRALRAALDELPDSATMLTLVPMAVRRDPVRQALLEALVARTHGANYLWGPDDPSAAEAVAAHADEIGVAVVDRPPTGTGPTIAVDEVHRRLADGQDIPDGVAPRRVVEELRHAMPPRHARGLTVFFTGLSGSGKSTIANIVATRLLEDGGRTVTLLDGDLVRQHLSSELGFSREHRNINVLRIGYVASEITKHGGTAVCAPIAPYDDIRRQNRQVIEATGGGYVLVHVATPLEVCEARDRKGLYAKARAGVIAEFTGISDPYEVPHDAELSIDTTDITPEQAAAQVLDHLRDAGWLQP